MNKDAFYGILLLLLLASTIISFAYLAINLNGAFWFGTVYFFVSLIDGIRSSFTIDNKGGLVI